METSKKYLIWAAAIIITFILVVCFASQIQVWMMSKMTELLILIISFGTGWILGRFGGSRKRKDQE